MKSTGTLKIESHVSFCYGHRLPRYCGKCSQLHGHNARVVVQVAHESHPLFRDEVGILLDLTILRRLMKEIADQFDHGSLIHEEDTLLLPALENAKEKLKLLVVPYSPTAENILLDYVDRLDAHLPDGFVVVWAKMEETANNAVIWER